MSAPDQVIILDEKNGITVCTCRNTEHCNCGRETAETHENSCDCDLCKKFKLNFYAKTKGKKYSDFSGGTY